MTLETSAEDVELVSRVEQALHDTPGLDASRVTVSASNGNVVLRGSMISTQDHDRAVGAAWKVVGIKNVATELRVTGDRPS